MKYHVSILDTDLYKLTMQNAICKLFPRVKARYTFINRDGRKFPPGFGERLREIVQSFEKLNLYRDEKDFLQAKCYYLDPLYFDILAGYRYDPSEVTIKQKGTQLSVSVEGYWYRTVLWEVPLMATISELYFEMTGQSGVCWRERRIHNRIKAKDLWLAGAYYSEFGTRRRHSFENQDRVITDMNSTKYGMSHLLGTSNVYLAMKHDLIPMGTQAHEWIMGHGAMYDYKVANEKAMESWVDVYQGNLGMALTDTYTTDVFLRSFNTMYAKLFDGVRQDSGDPLAFVRKILSHYEKLRIAPEAKVVMFSDNLKSAKQISAIHKACSFSGRQVIIDRYGIGTWLSNDVGVKPLNIVIKLTSVDFGQGWTPTVKLSDDLGKNTGDGGEVALCKRVLGIDPVGVA